MSELKITIDQLKNYLGTGLKMKPVYKSGYNLGEPIIAFEPYALISLKLDQIVPICYHLSDLDKFIPELGFVPLQELFQLCYESIYDHRFDGEFDSDPTLGEYLAVKASEEVMCQDYNYGMTVELPNQFLFSINGGYTTVPNFDIYQKLFQWHFWPFGDEYFEAGLVIDKLLYNPTTN